jgi:hypothetical protein
LPSIEIHAAPEASGTGVVPANGSWVHDGDALAGPAVAAEGAALPEPGTGLAAGLGAPLPPLQAATIAKAPHAQRLTGAL